MSHIEKRGAAIMITFGEGWEIPIFSVEEGRRRHDRIRELMAREEIDCLVIAGHTGNHRGQFGNIRYVSNYINWFGEEYCLFPRIGEPTLFVWQWMHEYWARKVSWISDMVSTGALDAKKGYGDLIAEKIRDHGLEKARIGLVSERSMSAQVYRTLGGLLLDATFVDAPHVLAFPRLVKSAEELEFVRKAGECADKGIEAMVRAARPGVTEYDVIAECESAMIKAGAEPGSQLLFRSKRWPDGWGLPHGGSMRRLQKRDVLLMELSPSYGGYYSHLLRPIVLGKPSDGFLRIFDVHKEMYMRAREELKPGNVTTEIEARVGAWAEGSGHFSFASPLIQFMDDCQSGPYDTVLEPNQVYAIHPYTRPPQADIDARRGHVGHILGDVCIVTDGAAESVSKLPLEVIVV
jgi:Xaa-Pro aminopeptidase